MDLQKLTKQHLAQKNDAELRRLLRKQFQYNKSSAITHKDKLIELIIDLRDEEFEKIAQQSGIVSGAIYTDVTRKEWKVVCIERAMVTLEDNQQNQIDVAIDQIKQSYVKEQQQDFSSKPPKSQSTPTPSKPQQQNTTPAKSSKSKSKSDLVREVIRKQHKSGEKMTSGTVMKELKDIYDIDIHRSFCSTILRSYKKILS